MYGLMKWHGFFIKSFFANRWAAPVLSMGPNYEDANTSTCSILFVEN